MAIAKLVSRIEQLLEGAPPSQVLSVALHLIHRTGSGDASFTDQQIYDCVMRIHSLREQHAAVAQELDNLASTEPCEFDPNQVWTLIRAIKVQAKYVDVMECESGNSVEI